MAGGKKSGARSATSQTCARASQPQAMEGRDVDVFASFRYSPAKRARHRPPVSLTAAERLARYEGALDDMHFVAVVTDSSKASPRAIKRVSVVIATHAGVVDRRYDQPWSDATAKEEGPFVAALVQAAVDRGCELVAHDASSMVDLWNRTAAAIDAKPWTTDAFFCTMRGARLRCGFASQGSKIDLSSSHAVYESLYGHRPDADEASTVVAIFVEGRARGWW